MNHIDLTKMQDTVDDKASIAFSKEIVAEDFYIPGDDLEANEFEVQQPHHSFADDLLKAQKESEREPRENTEKVEELATEITDQDEPENLRNEAPEHPESDFFDQPPSEEEEKQKTVENISGMSEICDETNEMEVTEEPELPKQSVQFTHLPDLVQPGTKSSSEGLRSSLTDLTGPRYTEQDSIPSTKKSLVSGNDMDNLILGRMSIRSTAMARESIVKRRETIAYSELGPRLGVVQDADDDFINFYTSPDQVIFFEEIAEEEESAVIVQEEELPKLNRQPFYKRHDQLSAEIAELKIYNFILQKKLAMYFKRKKMDYVTKDTESSFDQQSKYVHKLEAYGEWATFEKERRLKEDTDINETKRLREDKMNELQSMFAKMQSREGEIGYGLINTKTGNVIPDKLVDRLLNRQRIQMNQVSSMRLTYIRLRQMVQEKLDKIAALNEVAPGFLLADFEHLKTVNRSYSDKIEERDEELSKLRAKCANTIQVLAHLREKSAALANDLEDLISDKAQAEGYFSALRSRVNELKQERGIYRNNINQLRTEYGLLAQPMLLKDMENGLKEVEILSTNLNNITKLYRKRALQVKSIRKKIEEALEERKSPKKFASKIRCATLKEANEKPTIYRGRPTLMIPEIDMSVFDKFSSIAPNVTHDRCRHRSRLNAMKRSKVKM